MHSLCIICFSYAHVSYMKDKTRQCWHIFNIFGNCIFFYKYFLNLKAQGSSHIDVKKQNQVLVYEYSQSLPNATSLVRNANGPTELMSIKWNLKSISKD